MTASPVVNCGDVECERERFASAAAFGAAAVHLDVSDGVFSPVKIGGTPDDLRKLHAEFPGLEVHVHLMVARPEAVLADWIRAGAKRAIIHAEAVSDWNAIKNAVPADAELFVSIKKETPVDILRMFAGDEAVKGVHVLAVPIGFSGGKQDSETPERIREIKARWPRLKVSVDGGIDLETARAAKEAGVDEVVSATYIFGSSDSKKAYEELIAL